MKIEALGVIDINNDTPMSEDVFFVDSNVWFWLTYDRASLGDSKPKVYQLQSYPEYIDAAYITGSKMYRSGLSLSELSHLIEKVEKEIYSRTHDVEIDLKQFRRLDAERQNVIEQIELSWEQIKQMGRPLENEIINETTTDNALLRIKTQLLDGYDLYMIEFVQQVGIKNIISDDSDLASVPGIYLFTANQRIIEQASKQGKLVTRGN